MGLSGLSNVMRGDELVNVLENHQNGIAGKQVERTITITGFA